MKKIRLPFLLCLATLWYLNLSYYGALAQVTVPSEWKNAQMLGGGFVSGIIYSPTQKDLLYARTDVGGAYRWDAPNQTWIPISDQLSRSEQDFLGVISLATDPSNPNRVYLATGLYTQSWAGTGAILASTDKGNTWTQTKLSIKLGGNESGRSTGERLQVDPNLGSTLYLGSSTDGLWKSTDYGASWSQVSSFPVNTSPIGSGGISFVLFDKSSSISGTATNTIYVGVLQKGTNNLYRSTDGGTSWQAIPGQPTNYMPHHASLAADGLLYLTYSDGPGPNGVTAGDVMKYNTATGEWTSIRPDVGQQGGFAGLALDPLKPGTMMVSTIDRWYPKDEIFRSTDGGLTWKPLLATATFDHSLAPYAASSNPHWLGDLDLDPFNSDQAWFVTGYGVYGSKNITAADVNSPTAWSFLDKGLEETVPVGLISPPTGAPLISALGDIDGFKHDNLDVSPPAGRLSPRYGTNTSIDFAELQPNYMARTYNNSSGKYGSYSTDGGNSWTAFGSAPTGTNGGGSIAVSANGTTLVWNPGGATSLYYSRDNGTTWTASTGIGSLAPIADRVNAQKFYSYDAANGRVLVSTDGGATFSVGATNLPLLASWELWKGSIRAVFGVEGDLWLASPSGIFHSTNSGSSFVKITKVQEALRIGFGKAATGKTYPAVYIVGKINNTDGFYRSDDGGFGWVRINDNQHQFGGINALVGDPRTYGRVYLATSGRGVVYGTSQPYDGPAEEPGTVEMLFNENFGSWPGKEGGDAATYAGFSGKTQATYSGSNVFIQGWGGGTGYPGASGNATFLGKSVNEETPLVISNISIARYDHLNLSFGLAWQIWWSDPNIPNYRPTIEVKVDNGQWIKLTQTDSDYPTRDQEFKLIVMPLVDAAGKGLTGQKLSIRLSPASNGTNYRLDDLGVSGQKMLIKAQSITLATAGNVPAVTTPGSTLQLQATVLPDSTTNKSVTWTIGSGNEKATISATGLLTASASGTVTARATAKDGSGVYGELTVKIVVKAQSVSVVTAGNVPAVTTPGSTLQLQATVLPDSTTDKSVTWTIVKGSNKATISATGLLTAIASDTVIARATAQDGSGVYGELTVKIVVKAQRVILATAGNVPVLVAPGSTLQLLATVQPDSTTNKSVAWTIVGGGAKATISATGLLTAMANGLVTARATAQDGSGVYGELVVKITDIIPGRTYVISAHHSGKALSVRSNQTKDGIDVKQDTYTGATYQQWKLEEVGTGIYKLLAVHSGKSLSIAKGATKDGAKAEQATYVGAAYQQWKIEETGSGYYKLIAVHSSKALTVSNGQTKDGATVEQACYSGAAYQQWKFAALLSGNARITLNAEEKAEEKAVKVYPNPVTEGTFHVSMAGFESEERVLLKLMSLTGQVLYQQRVTLEGLVTITQPLQPGIYLVQVLGSKETITQKLIVH